MKPTDRFAFVIGLQDRSERAAGLFARTPEGGQIGIGAARVKKNKEKDYEPGKINGVVVMGGFIYYNSSDQTDLMGRPNNRADASGNLPMQFDTPTKRLYTASVMTNKLFATAFASEEYGAGMVRSEDFGIGSFGVGGVIKWGGTGATMYMVNGQYNYQDKYKVGFVTHRLPGYESSSGRAEVDLGKGYTLVVYGRYGDLQTNTGSIGSGTFTEISEKVKVLEDKIATATQTPGWEKSPTAASDVRGWAGEIITTMNQLNVLNIGDAFGYTTNQYSVGLIIPGKDKAPASEVKLSIAELKNQDGSKQGYLTNMTCVRLDKKKDVYLSFTAGVPIYKDDAPTTPSTSHYDKSIENFGGVKLDLGNVAFGVAGYNAGKENQALQFSAGWVNTKSGWIQEAGGSTTLLQDGYKNAVTIGNETLKLYITQGNVNGAAVWSAAERTTVALNNAAMLMFQAEYRNIKIEDLTSHEIALRGEYVSEDGLGVSGQYWKNLSKRSKVGGSDWGFNLGFSYVF